MRYFLIFQSDHGTKQYRRSFEVIVVPQNKNTFHTMASENQITNLESVANDIRSLEEEKITRPNLGDLSLKDKLQPKLGILNKKMDFAIQYAEYVHDDDISQVCSLLQKVFNILSNLASLDRMDYANQAESASHEIIAWIDNLTKHWPPFVTAAIEVRGFLEDEGIKKSYEDAVDEMKNQSSMVLREIHEQSKEVLDNAKNLAEEIENRARRTATGISVEEAQKQFEKAQEDLDGQVKSWFYRSITSIGLFIGVMGFFLWRYNVPDDIGAAIYYTAIRLTILAALGAVTTFSLRIYRSHLHMKQQNLHRQRIANSIASFVESATTPESRDLILSYLVQSVATFGNSGLVQDREDHVNPSRLIIDPVTKILTSTESK